MNRSWSSESIVGMIKYGFSLKAKRRVVKQTSILQHSLPSQASGHYNIVERMHKNIHKSENRRLHTKLGAIIVITNSRNVLDARSPEKDHMKQQSI